MPRLLLYFFLASVAFGAYGYQRSVSVCQNSTCPSNQSNYTVLVCANITLGNGNSCPAVAGLNQTGGGAHVQNGNGYDLVFSTSACASPTLMSWEIERYVAATGEIEAWVLVPSLSSGGSIFYLCYGNSSIVSFQGGAAGAAWDSSYVGVYHLPNGTVLSVADSTSHANAGANHSVTATTGQIDGGASLSGASQYISTPITSTFGDFTACLWFNTTANSFVQRLLDKTYNTGFWLGQVGSATQWGGGVLTTGPFTYVTLANMSAWHHICNERAGTTQTITADSTNTATATTSNALMDSSAFQIGAAVGGGNAYQGSLDEVRISSVARSANWITTDYNNQSAPSTFEVFGAETSTGCMASLAATGAGCK